MNQSATLNRAARPLVAEGDIGRVSAIAFLGLVAYLVLALIRFQEYTWVNFDAPIIPVIEVTMMLAWFASAKPPGLVHALPVFLLGGVYFISGLGVNADYSVEVTSNYFLNIAFVYVVLAQVAVDPRRADLVMAVFGTCMAVISLQCILMALHPEHMGWTGLQAIERTDSIPRVWQVRYIGTLKDPNDLGMTMLAALPMLAFLASTSRSRLLQLYFVGCLGACLYTIYLLNSRGTVVGLVAMVGLIGVLRLGIAKAVLLGGLLLPVAIILAPARIADTSFDQSALDRIFSWYNGMKMFTGSPLFGVGKDQYLTYYYKVSHNSWIEVVAELGMVGYLLWNRIVLGALVEVYQLIRADQTLELKTKTESKLSTRRARPRPGRARQALPGSTLPAEIEAPDEPATEEEVAAQPDELLVIERRRSLALFYSLAGLMVAIFFIDRSDSLITFLVCALIAGSLTRYKLQRNDVIWLPVAVWVYLGAFLALVLVYLLIQIFAFN